MQLSEDENHGKYFIRSYQSGTITINQTSYTDSLILTLHTIITDWRPQVFSELMREDFAVIVKEKPEIVLIGTGEKQYFPNAAVLSLLIENNIGYEMMDTGAACRTYNALASEGRRVVAAMILL